MIVAIDWYGLNGPEEIIIQNATAVIEWDNKLRVSWIDNGVEVLSVYKMDNISRYSYHAGPV